MHAEQHERVEDSVLAYPPDSSNVSRVSVAGWKCFLRGSLVTS